MNKTCFITLLLLLVFAKYDCTNNGGYGCKYGGTCHFYGFCICPKGFQGEDCGLKTGKIKQNKYSSKNLVQIEMLGLNSNSFFSINYWFAFRAHFNSRQLYSRVQKWRHMLRKRQVLLPSWFHRRSVRNPRQ